MANDLHLAMVQRWMERVHEVGIVHAIEEFASDDLRLENPGAISDLEGVRDRLIEFAEAFPDAEAAVEEIISDGNRLVLILEMTATHLGPLRTIEATGRSVRFNVAFVMELDGVQITRLRSYPEFFSVMEQIGIFPPFEAPPYEVFGT